MTQKQTDEYLDLVKALIGDGIDPARAIELAKSLLNLA